MKRLMFITLLMIVIISCAENSKKPVVLREDFRIDRLPWQTIMGTPNWILDKGILVIMGHAPYEQMGIINREVEGDTYEISTSMRLGEQGEAGVVLGYRDQKNFMRITMDNRQNRIALINRIDGIDKVEAESSISLSHREFHYLEIELTKSLLVVECDRLVVIKTGRPEHLEGRIGIYAGIASPPNTPIYANYDYIEVKQVP